PKLKLRREKPLGQELPPEAPMHSSATLDAQPHRACGACGASGAAVCHTQRDYDRFYCEWSKYDDPATATGGGLSPYDAARLATTAADIARVLPSRAASILDAGCATGGLLTALREQGFTAVAGLDPSPRCAAACRERGFEAYVGSISSSSSSSSASRPAHMPK